MKVIRDEITPALHKVSKNFGLVDKEIVKIASQVRNDIQARTKKGMNYKESGFVKYSPGYKKRKTEQHRKGSPVTIMWTGDTLNSMAVKKKTGGGIIYFPDKTSQNKASWHNFGMGKNPVREFFEFSKRNIDYIVKKLDAKILKVGV